MDIEGSIYAGHSGRGDGMALTITDIRQAAEAEHTGAARVRLFDRGETRTETQADGTEHVVPVRDFDMVRAVISGRGRGGDAEVVFERSGVHDPWRYSIEVPKGTDVPTDVRMTGVLNGVGDVMRAIHAARRALGLRPPRGTAHRSNLRTFDPDYTALNG